MRKQCETNNIPLDLPIKRQREEVKIEHPPEVVSLNSKLEMAEKIKKTNHKVLSDIVKCIESNCKSALEELDPDKLKIKVDSLDKSTFDKVMNLIDFGVEDGRK
jgi:hypothetical protein